MLKCWTCKNSKDTSEFYQTKRSKTGFKSNCKLCMRLAYEKTKINSCNCGCGQLVVNKYAHGHFAKTAIGKQIVFANIQKYNELHDGKKVTFRSYVVPDLGHRVRSVWEENICRIIKHLGFKYLYEPKHFRLSNGQTYIPDLYIPDLNLYVEVKGVWPNKEADLTKCQRFIDDKLGQLWIIDTVWYNRFMRHFKKHLGLIDRRSQIRKLKNPECEDY